MQALTKMTVFLENHFRSLYKKEFYKIIVHQFSRVEVQIESLELERQKLKSNIKKAFKLGSDYSCNMSGDFSDPQEAKRIYKEYEKIVRRLVSYWMVIPPSSYRRLYTMSDKKEDEKKGFKFLDKSDPLYGYKLVMLGLAMVIAMYWAVSIINNNYIDKSTSQVQQVEDIPEVVEQPKPAFAERVRQTVTPVEPTVEDEKKCAIITPSKSKKVESLLKHNDCRVHIEPYLAGVTVCSNLTKRCDPMPWLK